MKKAIVFGLGNNYRIVQPYLSKLYNSNIVALTDNDNNLWGQIIDGLKVISPSSINDYKYDIIIVTPSNNSQIFIQLTNMGISADIIMYCDSFTLFRETQEFINFNNKKVLEIGCGNGNALKFIAHVGHPEYIVGIDRYLNSWWNLGESENYNWSIKNGDAENLEFENSTFDVVISYFSFEHIGNTKKALSEIRRVLKPNGRFYTIFAPIWTSVSGHHFVQEKDDTWNINHLRLIPPWGHLYMNENEMQDHIYKYQTNKVLINEMIESIYHSNIINRRTRTEFLWEFIRSKMSIIHYQEYVAYNRYNVISTTNNKNSELTGDIIDKLYLTKYNYDDISVQGMKICLEKNLVG
ncbi:MAG: class I SAM-dependent methyltransferase [Oscillospiraceae bacterium]|nr:class I SAM-dependent methyltransferase [Oscillospiraceae bacterium]